MTTAAKAKPAAGTFSYGDQIKVHFKIKEGDSHRIQVFEGVVIRIKGSGVSRTFTVRKNSFGVGVERIFPMKSPLINKIELVKSGKVRRAKLYYLRDLAGKSARITEDKFAAAGAAEGAAAEEAPLSPVEPETAKSETPASADAEKK